MEIDNLVSQAKFVKHLRRSECLILEKAIRDLNEVEQAILAPVKRLDLRRKEVGGRRGKS